MTEQTNSNDQSRDYIPFSERMSKWPVIRHLAELRPEEHATYLAIPGWRMWECVSPLSLGTPEEYRDAQSAAGAKPQALYVSGYVDGHMFEIIADKYEKVTGRNVRPNYAAAVSDSGSALLLEPLTVDEVKTIDELGEASGPAGSTDKPHELIRPDELRKILGVY